MSFSEYEQWDGEVYIGNYEFDLNKSFKAPTMTQRIEGNRLMEIKQGNIYRWHYKDDAAYRQRSPNGTAYWCLDQQCVAIDYNDSIELVDTYWNGPDPQHIRINDTTHFVEPDKVNLEFICNTNNVIGLNSWEVEDYDVVYNLSWQKGCHKEYATDAEAYKKGPSKNAVLKKLENQLQRAHEDLRSAQWSIERINKEIEELIK